MDRGSNKIKKVLLIAMLIIAIGLVWYPRCFSDRDRHDHDSGHDYEHHDCDNHDHDEDTNTIDREE